MTHGTLLRGWHRPVLLVGGLLVLWQLLYMATG